MRGDGGCEISRFCAVERGSKAEVGKVRRQGWDNPIARGISANSISSDLHQSEGGGEAFSIGF